MRSFAVTLLISSALWAQTGAQKPVFEAASVKPSAAGAHGSHWNTSPGLLRATMTLKSYVAVAYTLPEDRVSGGAGWVDGDHYDIVAKLDRIEDAPPPANAAPRERGAYDAAQLYLALQGLLAERFQLKVHRLTKEIPAYALRAVKGSKLKEATETQGCGTNSSGDGSIIHFAAICVDIHGFAGFLTRRLHQPVADRTNLTGHYSFTFDYTSANKDGAPVNDAYPLLPDAIQSFGLKLEAQKVPADFVVIDSAERPPDN